MRIAVNSQGGGRRCEHKARYSHSASFPALATGAWARRGEIAAGLIFLSFIVMRRLDDGSYACVRLRAIHRSARKFVHWAQLIERFLTERNGLDGIP